MRKAVFFGVLAIFSLFLPRLILAESGCGGIDFCQSTKIVNEYTCREIEGSCQKEGAGTQTIDCTVTEDECYGFQYTPRCAYNLLGACEEQGFTRKKVSCCSGAGGGGGQDCPSGEYELVKECKPTNQCPADRTGAKCGQGKKWCYSLVCVGCTATAPTNLTFTPFQSGSSAVVSWVDGAGGTSNRLYVDSRKEDVDADCPNGQGSGNGKCLYVNNNASSGVAVSGLSLGTVYYVKVVNYKDGTCSANSSILSDVSSCFISPSGPVNMKVGDKQTFTTSVNTSLEIQRVDFSAPPGNISITPGSDTNGADGYKTEVTALNSTSPTVTLTSDVYFTGNPTPVC
ncbi:MAG: hypothetical protein UV59_C0051G0006 [Candidatus Gottesmanbacteria bacterium GW2011_GWA1_43_11]|uniref:Fibronectin type-III domain-containing protein n=1 Tax=Candidatus Gottesmanbacteria bacterium GW2011_GWA1_43_11 TaxID=1618436 RepID=A0A0G1CC32_9BACT|nr:MAG: hypothetical protein UV59_C0051G0006 [Candidatus Gottesmanbacteria bacterium GW2011_GWA1_43_11]